MRELPESCLKLITPDIRRRLKIGKTFGPFVCENEYYTVTREGPDSLTWERVEMPTVQGVGGGGVKKSCGGCGQNTQQAAPVGDVDMREYFDLVFLLNLPRRTDRRTEMEAHLAEIDWPFRQPELFTATDAQVCPPPPWWPHKAGSGAWGCMESHRHMLANALSRGAKRVLILEDDFFAAVENFAEAASSFVRAVPADWEMLYFGGQAVGRDGSRFREPVGKVFRVAGIERTHAYAVQGDMIRDLYTKLITSVGHCDHVMGPFQKGRKVYAPAEWLAGQRASKSDIGSESGDRLWQAPPKDWPVTLFIGSPEGAKKYREEHKLHGGHNLRGETDIGIIDLMRLPTAERRKALEKWLSMIEWEGRSKTPARPPFIYGVPESLAAPLIGERLHVVSDMPSLGTTAKNAAKAVGRIIAAAVTGGEVQVLNAQREERLALCRVCDKLTADRCVDCGCYVAEKAKLATEHCPLNKWNLPVTVFYHVAAMNHWRDVASEQLTTLQAAGLDAATVTFLGKKADRKWLQTEAKKRGIVLDIAREDENLMHYETFAMLAIERWARKNEHAAALYLHTKGVSAPGHAGKARWRELMMREVVTEWRRNLETLRSADAVGCNWREGTDPHFCGNFWLARADYLRTLPNFAEFHASKNRVRHTCELWIGQGYKPRIVSLAHRNVDYCAAEWFG